MRTSRSMRLSAFLVGLMAIMFTGGCRKLSEVEEDPSAGVNGGFEIDRNGLPVNWIMYTSNTVPEAEFRIVLDKEVFKEGKQSLRFDVERCAAGAGGWHAPGFTKEFFDKREGRYRVSCWIQNVGSTYCINAGGVSAMSGKMKTLVKSNEQTSGWKRLEYEVDIPKENWLRLQLNLLKPGTFWIDDVRIERIDG